MLYEYFIVAVAAILAGVGTGLAGLSAATAMVPILIVLCPTFGGEYGVYMATALALASDIIGSAVTSYIYAKNKKLDLKHGWVLMVCIITMCMLGSAAAYITKQAVLGSFSLVLCIAIGIRFLVKPGSKDRPARELVEKLKFKEIIISIVVGVVIGFGTGYFGSGGGMMMLIIFTAFLGYDRKTAVGTSTFIMTFTALIASVSHIIIEPDIIKECWGFLILSVVLATTASIVSAQFANKVNNTAVGCVTGATLLLLGVTMTFIEIFNDSGRQYLGEFFRMVGIFFGYMTALGSALVIIRFTVKVPDYLFRKLLHFVAFSTILPLAVFTEVWWISVAVVGFFIAVVFMALISLENMSFYKSLFVEKHDHEVLTSFLLLFVLIGGLLAIFWGWLGVEHSYMAVAAIMAWGPADGAAAIVGTLAGKHKLQGRFIEGVKSVEGTVAMGVTSFAFTLVVFLLMSGMTWYFSVILALIVGVISAFTELFTKRGLDTVTVPAMTALIMAFTLLFKG